MRPIDVYQRQPSTGLAKPGESKYQRPQSSAVDLADVLNLILFNMILTLPD